MIDCVRANVSEVLCINATDSYAVSASGGTVEKRDVRQC
jgi:hypothetical protein